MGTLQIDSIQRYRTVTEICARLGVSKSTSILDVGGGTGGLAGELEVSSYTTLDPTGGGPRHVRGSMENLPFDDRSFDLVLQADALEHVPASIRSASIAEMCRVSKQWVVWIGPVDHPETVRCEQDLCRTHRELLGGREMNWLAEHRVHGLPEVETLLFDFGLYLESWIAWKSGSLERWWLAQRLDLQLEAGVARPRLSEVLNTWYSEAGWKQDYRIAGEASAYRRVLVGSKGGPLPAELDRPPEGADGLEGWKGALGLLEFLAPRSDLGEDGLSQDPATAAQLARLAAILDKSDLPTGWFGRIFGGRS